MKILLVDDETDAGALFAQRFRREIANKEVQLTFACSGDEALACLGNREQAIELVLSDINMPGMSGLELLEKIRQKPFAPAPFVLMISAYGDEENYNRSLKLGANDFLTKPVDFVKLKERIRMLRPKGGPGDGMT